MLAMTLAMTALTQSQPPALPREFRAAWVATVDNIDWPSKPGLSTDQQKSEMIRILDTAEKLNMNAIIFQIRPSADSLYKSKLEPWSWFLTANSGGGPSQDYDPLTFTVAEAHKRGIELHVWFNPYRAGHPAQKGEMHKSHISKTHPDVVYKYGNFMWMDPGAKSVQDRSFAVFMDVLQRYDIDGIHIDDYFYPYPVRESGKTIPFPDAKTYAAFQRQGGKLSLSDWRRKNVDDFIKRLYSGIKQRKPWVKFGISPFGIYRPGVPKGITAGIDQYEELSADALKWWEEGWCDYFSPQLYWPIEQTPQSFPVLLDYWKSTNGKKRHLWPGLFTSRLGDNAVNWNPEQVVRQLNMTNTPAVNGAVHFSMKTFLNNWQNLNQALIEGPYKERKLVPSTPWLDAFAPKSPNAKLEGSRLTLPNPLTDDARFYAIQAKFGNAWKVVRVVGASQQTLDLTKELGGASSVSVALIDRTGNASPHKVVR